MSRRQPTFQSLLFIPLFGIAVFGLSLRYVHQKQAELRSRVSPSPTIQPIDTSDWQTYKNLDGDFSILYPPTGVGPTNTTISCGNAIVEAPTDLGLEVEFENYFGLLIKPNYPSIRSYLANNNLDIDLRYITIKGADEAYQVIPSQQKPTSLEYIARHNKTIVSVYKFNGTTNGCFPPQNWNFSQSFSFPESN